MSAKVIIIILILVLIGVGVWWFYNNQQSGTPVASQNTSQSNAVQANGTASASQATSPKDSSDAALNQDMTNIDTQMNGLNSASAEVDQGLNDKPISQ